MKCFVTAALAALSFSTSAFAAGITFDENNFGGDFNGQNLGVLPVGTHIIRGSNDGTCLSQFGGIICDVSVPQDDLQDDVRFSIGAGTQLTEITVTAGGFGPASLATEFRFDLPPVPIFNSTGQQITTDLPLYIDSLFVGQSTSLLDPANAIFLYSQSEPSTPISGAADFLFSSFSGNSNDSGRFGVQWQASVTIAPVPLPASAALMLCAVAGIGLLRSRIR